MHPGRPRPPVANRLAREERHDLTTELVRAERTGRLIEPGVVQMIKQGMHGRCPRTCLATDRVAEPDRATCVAPVEATSLVHYAMVASRPSHRQVEPHSPRL